MNTIMETRIFEYKNGNSTIFLTGDGSRIINWEGSLVLDYPLNLDIRVSTQCSFGKKSNGEIGFCSFCHESAMQEGRECDYEVLKQKLTGLPEGIELAVGVNQITHNLIDFIYWCNYSKYIVNLTINQGHINRDIDDLKFLIENNFIYGLGISYRQNLKWDVPHFILDYENTVFHVICGIDDFGDVMNLRNRGVKKVLVLGEKDFGFNKGMVDLQSTSHRQWYWWVSKLFSLFEIVSFDNLALDQLNIQRFFFYEKWEEIYQGEHSFYINAVEGYFSPSSRSSEKTDWNSLSVKDYYKSKIR